MSLRPLHILGSIVGSCVKQSKTIKTVLIEDLVAEKENEIDLRLLPSFQRIPLKADCRVYCKVSFSRPVSREPEGREQPLNPSTHPDTEVSPAQTPTWLEHS